MSRLTSVWSREMGYPFDTTLAHNLTWWRNAVLTQDMDCVAFVDGKEGSGKSLTLAPQIAAFLDVERSIELSRQYFWELDKFERAVMGLPKGKAVVLDEAGRYLDRRQSGARDALRVRKLLWECRRRNLFLIFVMPSFFDCDMTVSVHRTRFLVHAGYRFRTEEADYETGYIPPRPLERGHCRFYSEEGKKRLYLNDDLRRSYAYPLIAGESFDFRVAEHYHFDREEYKALRDEAERNFFSQDEGAPGERCPRCGGTPRSVSKRTGVARCAKGHEWDPAAVAAEQEVAGALAVD